MDDNPRIENGEEGMASPAAEFKPCPRLHTANRQQLVLRPLDVEHLVEEDHPVRAIWELVGQLVLDPFYDAIQAVEGGVGRSAWDPRVLLSLWLYAYSQGVSSAREISRLCSYNPAYQWVTGLEEISYHTLSDFRVQHGAALEDLFTQVLGVLSYEGLVTLKRVMHDGTKMKACASRQSFRREATLEEHLEAARQQVEEMGDPLSEQPTERVAQARQRAKREKQERLEAALGQLRQMREDRSSAEKKQRVRASETDPEARIMQQSDGGYAPSYNVQISTDAEATVIVGCGVSQAANDTAELVPAVERIKANLGTVPEQVVVDGGFITQEAIVEMEGQGVELIGPVPDHSSQTPAILQKRGVSPEFFPSAFVYDEGSNSYTCPAGQKLAYEGREKNGSGFRYRYRARGADCRECEFQGQCCPGSARGRSVVRTEEVAEVKAYREKMQTETVRTIYKQRPEVAEFPNAWIKEKFRLRQFRLRGLIKVTIETLWACLAYNLCQWIRLRWKPLKAALSGLS